MTRAESDPDPGSGHATPATAPTAADAVLTIAPQTARLIEANAAGRRLMSMDGGAATMVFDAAMPAIGRLRTLLGDDLPSEPVALTFWTPDGVRSLTCQIERGLDSAQYGPLLILRTETSEGAAEAAQSVPAVEPPSVAPSPADDTETLRKIAGRIREAQLQVATDAGEPVKIAPGPPTEQPMPNADPIPPEGAPAVNDDGTAAAPAPPGRADGEAELNAPAEPRSNASQDRSAAAAPIDLAKLAHELKSPISAIAAASEIIKDERFGPIGNARYAGYIDGIHESARHALNVIDRLLSRPPAQAGALPPQIFARFDVNAVVASCVSALRPLAEARAVTLSLHDAGTPLMITADETSVRQIVTNLVSNALKFTPARGRIDVGATARKGGPVTLSVRDTGPGMSPVAIADAMKPVPHEAPIQRDGGGLGLGLPIAHALARANGATLAIDSAPGSGTTVRLVFARGKLVGI